MQMADFIHSQMSEAEWSIGLTGCGGPILMKF